MTLLDSWMFYYYCY